MKVFISWSGPRSQRIATLMRGWLGDVIQALEPWMSEEDIRKGARWTSEMAVRLQDSHVGLICVTPENLNEPWITFEAGAVSKSVDSSLLCPVLFGLEPQGLTGPLVQFQATPFRRAEMRKLIESINRALPKPIDDARLTKSFEQHWDTFRKEVESTLLQKAVAAAHRSESDRIDEILELVRQQVRMMHGFSLDWFSSKKLRKLERVVELAEDFRGGLLSHIRSDPALLREHCLTVSIPQEFEHGAVSPDAGYVINFEVQIGAEIRRGDILCEIVLGHDGGGSEHWRFYSPCDGEILSLNKEKPKAGVELAVILMSSGTIESIPPEVTGWPAIP